ncbi:MAG: class I SAM-dependent methyltransferase [Nitrospirae bacterium]|nr:class I SAM-dependent methyltransferase [Nitrospirota bacterium]
MYDDDYFEADYFYTNQESIKTVHYNHFVEIADIAKEHCTIGNKLLEIGPGKGTFLKMCIDRGIHAEALELSPNVAQKLTNQLGCNVYPGLLDESVFENETYAMVVAFDVIEHCTDPMQWLKNIYRILKPGGILALSTVNIYNFLYTLGHALYKLQMSRAIEKLYPPYHLYYFTPVTLRKYMSETGFSIMKIQQENYDYRNATSDFLEQLILRIIYLLHNVTGNKTNQYIIASKPME